MAAPRLGINVDHVATVRNARGGTMPDPVRAALVAIAAGADGITAHLREDRRHIRDGDLMRLKRDITKPLNFEMAATEEMVRLAMATKPHAACIVPEKREERTTEGGLDVIGGHAHLLPSMQRLRDAGIRVSLFIEPDEAALRACVSLGAPVVELHTGTYCDAVAHGETAKAAAEFDRLRSAARIGTALGLEVHAGHGIDFATGELLATIPEIVEFNIGHFLMGEAIFIGLPEAVRLMKEALAAGRARAA